MEGKKVVAPLIERILKVQSEPVISNMNLDGMNLMSMLKISTCRNSLDKLIDSINIFKKYLFIYLFIYLFGCVWSLLRLAGSLLRHAGFSLVVACGFSLP